MVQFGKTLHPDGEELGWEVLAHDFCRYFHSWLCAGLERTARDRLGISPRPRGLLSAESDARAVAEANNREEIPGEPLAYFPFAVFRCEGGGPPWIDGVS